MNQEKQGENLMRTSFIARSRSLLFIFLLALTPLVSRAFEVQGDAANGKAIFNANCASCHKLDKKLIGPALGDVTERRELDWIVAWIKDNAALRASGDADAKALFKEYNGSVMSAFPQLSEEDINDILAYTVEGSKPKVAVTPNGPIAPGGPSQADGDSNLVVMLSLSGFLVLLIILLVKVKNTLKAVKGDSTSTLLEDSNFWTRAIVKSKAFIILATILVAVFLLSEAYYGMMGVGLNAQYQPVQPIAFSHKIHAGENKVDCNYCHSSARFSKHSGIPSANVCMNCHMYIDGSEIQTAAGELKYEGEKSPEIAKIYSAIGWDSEDRSYIPDYEEQPIKWVRIHNLPDLAYFNHAQHVSAGQIECQTCHGPIQEMEEVYQYSPLTMGWCIDCHRETEIQVETNGYYAELHAKLKEKYGDEPITVEKIGGLECGKCHY